jgi:hypothetical protein
MASFDSVEKRQQSREPSRQRPVRVNSSLLLQDLFFWAAAYSSLLHLRKRMQLARQAHPMAPQLPRSLRLPSAGSEKTCGDRRAATELTNWPPIDHFGRTSTSVEA